MKWITQKRTENVVATDVPDDQLDAVLTALPTGVYAVEYPDGIEYAEVVVRGGRLVRYNYVN